MVNSNKIGRYNLKIKLPANVNELLSSTEKPTNIESLQGRKVYSWEKTSSYASTLTVTWQSLNVNIDVERIVPQEVSDVFTVKNIIRNNGATISNVVLLQTFLESDFDPVSPLEEFKIIQDGNDRRLEWKKEIQSMPSGAALEFAYSLKVLNRGENVLFRPLYVYADGALVKIVERQEYTTRGIESAKVDETKSLEKQVVSGVIPELKTPERTLPIPFTNKTTIAPESEEAKPEKISGIAEIGGQTEKPSKPSITKNKNLIWSSAVIIALLLVVLVFVFLNRKKKEGIRF